MSSGQDFTTVRFQLGSASLGNSKSYIVQNLSILYYNSKSSNICQVCRHKLKPSRVSFPLHTDIPKFFTFYQSWAQIFLLKSLASPVSSEIASSFLLCKLSKHGKGPPQRAKGKDSKTSEPLCADQLLYLRQEKIFSN